MTQLYMALMPNNMGFLQQITSNIPNFRWHEITTWRKQKKDFVEQMPQNVQWYKQSQIWFDISRLSSAVKLVLYLEAL